MLRSLLAGLATCICVPASAAPITYTFSGVVTHQSGFEVSSLTGEFTFDSAVPDSDPDPRFGFYSGPTFRLSLEFDGGVISRSIAGESTSMTVTNNLPGGDLFPVPFDVFLVFAEEDEGSQNLFFFDDTGTVFTSDALPTFALPLAAFNHATWAFQAGGSSIAGDFTALRCVSGCMPAALPEPGTLMLVAAALGALTLRRRLPAEFSSR